MATWLIGIDESGKFNTLDRKDGSYVCAVVLRDRTVEDIEKLFVNVSQSLDLYYERSNDVRENRANLLQLFHGGVQEDDVRDRILNEILIKEKGLIKQVIKSNGRPYVAVNPQQWWTAATLGVIKKFFDTNEVAKNDEVHIIIDTRAYICLGLLQSTSENAITNILDVILDQENCDDARKLEMIREEVARLHKSVSKSAELEKKNLEKYGKSLAEDLQSELIRNFNNNCKSCTVEFLSSRNNPLSALADQMVNLRYPANKVIERLPMSATELRERLTGTIASPLNTSLGRNAEALYNDGHVLEACEALLACIFDQNESGHNYDQIELLPRILDSVTPENEVAVWEAILDACLASLENRGQDGDAIMHVTKVLDFIRNRYESIPKSLVRYFRFVIAEHAAHTGVFTDQTFAAINNSFKSADPNYYNSLERWNEYVEMQAYIAQCGFDSYDFDCVAHFDDLIKTQTAVDQIKFPFVTKFEDSSLPKDENYAMIYGTLGQAEAFKGNLAKAIEYFEKDLVRATPKSVSKPASYMTVVYHRLKDIVNAQRCFELQAGMPMAEFDMSHADQWTNLNYLRLLGLGYELGMATAMPALPEESVWKHSGNYPGPLLCKWAAYIQYQNGNVNDAIRLLEEAAQNISSGCCFAIIALKLPLIAMQIYIKKANGGDLTGLQRAFTKLTGKIIIEFPNFQKYYNCNYELFDGAANGNISLWEAAMLLPFNYS